MKKVLFLAMFFSAIQAVSLKAQVTIGAIETPSEWSLLDLKETAEGTSTKALHLPRLATIDRNALTGRVDPKTWGLLIYNTTTNCLEYWNLQKWVSLCAGQAAVTFNKPDGSDAGDITKTPFPAGGGTQGPYVPQDEPNCLGKDPAYSFLVTLGEEYTYIDVKNSMTGQFTLSQNANNTALSRHAIVRVINNCTNEYKEFVFTQEGDDSGCGSTASIPDIQSGNGLSLASGGAVYLHLDGYPTSGTYIWTLGEVEKGRGPTYTATVPGVYKVYADKIGCTNVTPKTVTVTSGSGGVAPSPVAPVIAKNMGFVCSQSGETDLFTQQVGPGDIVWYKDGAKQPSKTGASISANIGEWFAVVEDGSSSSVPSNTVSVCLDPASGAIISAPTFTINGVNSAAAVNVCGGGALLLKVTNQQPNTTYTWLMDNTEKGVGTQYEMNLAGVTSDFILQCRATGAECSCSSVSDVSISLGSAPPTPSISVNTPGQALCNGTATLTANAGGSPDSYFWFYSGVKDGTYLVVTGETGPTLTITQEGWYKVAAKKGDCVSELSTEKGVTLSSGVASATIAGDQTGINPGDTRTYTATMNNPQGATYRWTISGAADPTPTTGVGASIAVRFNAAGTATLNLTAENACGTASVTNNNYAVTVAQSCTPAGVSAHAPSSKELSLTEGNISGSLAITPSGSPTLSYQWYLNSTSSNNGGSAISNETATTFSLPSTLTVAGSPYYYYCVVTSNCGSSSTATSDVFTVRVNPNPATLPAATLGSGTLTGKVCFDVAITEGGAECGTLASRASQKADFSQSATAVQTYTFTPGTGTISNVRFYAVEDAAFTGQIIQSMTYNGNVATVTYKNVNADATGHTRSNPLKATIYVVFYNGAEDVQLSRSVTIMDCLCCPGYFAQGGEYKPGNTAQYLNIPDYTSFDVLTNPSGSWKFAKTGKDLCFYKTGANNGSELTWANATNGCALANTAYNDGTTGWRLPNVAELGVIRLIYSNLASQASSAAGTTNLRTNNHWSSTEVSTTHVMMWTFGAEKARVGTKSGYRDTYARCVKTY